MIINWNVTILSRLKQIASFVDDSDLIVRGTIAITEWFVEMDQGYSPIALIFSICEKNIITLDRKRESCNG